MTHRPSFQMIAEIKEFASFTSAEQRYIRRSLDVAANGVQAAERWCRNPAEGVRISAQARLYRTLHKAIRISVPDDIAFDSAAELLGPLISLAAFDLSEGKLSGFAAFRFLYERLLGAAVRPWLPSAFLAAAALPTLHPSDRKSLLGSVTAADAGAPGWSIRKPLFTPEWIEKVPMTVS